MFEKSRKRRGRPFVKGDPHAGRPKGATNVASREIKDVARRILEDAAYQAGLVTRLRAGRTPHVEVLLFHYAFGNRWNVMRSRPPSPTSPSCQTMS
jgi:hypothetical protein